MTGAELFVRTLGQLGITDIFTLVGDHLNEVLAAARRAGFRIIDMRHEAAVAHAADAWARLHRKPALALLTGGPGHTNALTGIATAQLAGSPLIAVSGAPATRVAQRQAFQEIDQVSMTRPVVKWAAQPTSAEQIPFFLARAYAEANSGRKGAVHLTIPVDLFTEQASSGGVEPRVSISGAPDITGLLAAIQSAERPVIIAGAGLWWADAGAELTRFIETTNVPLYTISMARGVISDEHPLCMGYGDPALNHAVQQVFREADLVVVLGKRLDFRLAFGGARVFAPSARFAQVDIHPQELGWNRALEIAICADLKQTLGALLDEIGNSQWPARPWLERVRVARQQWREKLEQAASDRSTPIHPAALYMELKRRLPPDVLYSWDGGDFVHWGRAILSATNSGGWVRLGPMGTIGAALPNAIALQLANPGQPVVLITGDGSFGFYIAELDTAVRNQLPIVIIVGNDAAWGLERELQTRSSPEGSVACELRATRYDVIMQGFGGGGETVNTLDEIAPALDRAFASGSPYCINVNVRGARSPFTEWQLQGKA